VDAEFGVEGKAYQCRQRDSNSAEWLTMKIDKKPLDRQKLCIANIEPSVDERG
jgi:hypothetical protein